MARPLRIEFPGALYHVISRGNERQNLVRDDADRQKRLDWLRRTVEVYGWRLHAFVLLSNRDHLFVKTPEGNLSAGMQHYNGSYTSYFNRRHRRAGHLFQGRAAGRRAGEATIAARAVAAYLARCQFGYPASETARVLGYGDHSGVGRAVRRVEQGGPELQRTIQGLARQLTNP